MKNQTFLGILLPLYNITVWLYISIQAVLLFDYHGLYYHDELFIYMKDLPAILFVSLGLFTMIVMGGLATGIVDEELEFILVTLFIAKRR